MNKKQYQNEYQNLIRNKTLMEKMANELGLTAILQPDGTYDLE